MLPYALIACCLLFVTLECQEEANVPPELARRAIPTGAVSYEAIYNGGLKRDVLFTFDLHLPQV